MGSRSVACGEPSFISPTWMSRPRPSTARFNSWMPNSTSFPRGATFRWWREEKPSVAYADILTRGIYTARKERVEANTPHFLPPLPPGQPHNRLALGRMDGQPGESFDRAGHGQSYVERALRRRPGGDHGGLWDHGPAAFASPAARLAGSGIPRERLGHEAYVQAHGDVRRLPPECEINSATVGPGSEEPSAGAWAALPHGCRDAA